MCSKATDTNDLPPEHIVELLDQYAALNLVYEEKRVQIAQETEEKIAQYVKKRSLGKSFEPLDATQYLQYINEFVDNLVTYYSYYRSERRSLATLFASIGITDHRMFAEMVRVASDPRIAIQIGELDVPGIRWFLGQFLSDFENVIVFRNNLVDYLPRLEEATQITHSAVMQRFLDVIRYVTSQTAESLREKGILAVDEAIRENTLSKKVNFIVEAISAFVENAQNHPAFILTESKGYFGTAELEEFDKKIQSFSSIRNMFKEHVSLYSRARWVFERHHQTIFNSIFKGTHFELVEIIHKIRRGTHIQEYRSKLNDCQSMLLGVSQANTLFLEYVAYHQQMQKLVESYKQIAEFLQSELLFILYNMEFQQTQLFSEYLEQFKSALKEIQQMLIQVCSLEEQA
jgi:hypothetical protein